MLLGAFSQSRGFFEDGQKFPDKAPFIEMMKVYERSASDAAYWARQAISCGRLVDKQRAQWHEACTATMERTLAVVLHAIDKTVGAGELEMPTTPAFPED